VLGTGRSNKNDPNDALSVAIAALRSPGLRSVEPDSSLFIGVVPECLRRPHIAGKPAVGGGVGGSWGSLWW